MANRSRREEMRLLLARRDRRGLTYRELSEECGIPAHTLSWWAWKLRSEAPAEPSFVELEVHADASSASLEIETAGGHLVRVSAGFEAEALRRVLEVLGSC